MSKSKKTLTPQQKLFAYEYVIDRNATQAAIRAGYSKKTAYSQGQRLLKNVEVAKLIDKLTKKKAKKLELSAEKVLSNIIEIEETCRRIIETKDDAGKVVSKRVADAAHALKANELLGKHLKLFTDVLELDTKKPLEINIIKTYAKEGQAHANS